MKLNSIKQIINRESEFCQNYFPKNIRVFTFHRLVCEIERNVYSATLEGEKKILTVNHSGQCKGHNNDGDISLPIKISSYIHINLISHESGSIQAELIQTRTHNRNRHRDYCKNFT